MEDLNQLKIVLAKKKRTNKWLAEQLGVNQTTVSKWCTNTTQPDLQTLKRITELLEVNIQDLTTRFTNIETYNRTVRSEHSRLNKLLVK